MTAILGISAYYHDSAAALIVDGELVAAAQEERFTRIKHDAEFPKHAMEFCLQEAGLQPDEIDYAVFYEKPFRKFERLLETFLAFVPAGYRSFRQAIPVWLKQKLHLRGQIVAELGDAFQGKLVFTEHHESHAASAFFPSPFDDAAIITVDGVGEWSTTCLGAGQGNHVELFEELRFPHSLGLLYSAFTYYCGFKVNSGEYKLMGLAPYGQPVYEQAIFDHLIDVKADGSYRMDLSYFDYCTGLTMTSGKFHQLFGGPPRAPESDITQKEMDLAASVQRVTEQVVARMANHLHTKTNADNLVLAGGVALNCVSNGRLLREGPFKNIWVQPAAGDAGGALGAALFAWYQLLGNQRQPQGIDTQKGSLLGPQFDDTTIEAFLRKQGVQYSKTSADEELCQRVAELIENGNVVGWFQGRMEFGPRALGSRSILGDARSPTMQSVMNQKIKFRESFRPFAPVVMKEFASEYFEIEAKHESPYMSFVANVHQRNLLPMDKIASTEHNADQTKRDSEKLSLLNQLQTPRSTIPAVTHVDNSARLQTVDRARFPLLHQLLSEFHDLTQCPVLINTSFNVRGEPIVCSPEDAYRCFMATEMDVLAIGHFVILKSEQNMDAADVSREQYLTQFALD